MAVFAGITRIVADNKKYLVWLGHAKELQIFHGSSILHATDPLLTIPKSDVQRQRKLGEYGVSEVSRVQLTTPGFIFIG